MANRKISDLTALTAPASGDLLPIVDISEAAAADKNKKITYGELLASAPTGSAAAPSFSFDGDPNTGIFNPAADTLAFVEGGVEAMRIDSSGRPLVGTSSARGNLYNGGYAPSVQFETVGTNLQTRGLSLAYNNATDTGGPLLHFITSRGSTAGSNTLVASGDELGGLSFTGADGTRPIQGASINAYVDGTPGDLDMPGRLVFSVTADGASSPTEALRIKNSRIINIANTPVYADNAAAKTGGLVDGDVYRKSDGTLMIVYT
jgi:hypothetical protein